jgi:putative addiction module component (TIGR02574 family)
MSTAEIMDQLRVMPAAERPEVVGKIWAEFADQDLGLTPVQAAELDRRLAEHQAHPADVVPWNEIKAATEAKYGRKP